MLSRAPQVFLASRNAKKLAEMQRILAEHVPDIEVLGLDDVTPYDEPAETEPTFEGNALIKARVAVEATGLPSLADDSGLCVDALNGMPGVLSARWAGTAKDDRANNELLLEQLADVPDERRGAHFTCAVAFAYPVGAGGIAEHVVHGTMPGRIIREMRGSGGFGYDVLFVRGRARPDLGRAAARREGRDLAPRPGAARDRPDRRRRAGRPLMDRAVLVVAATHAEAAHVPAAPARRGDRARQDGGGRRDDRGARRRRARRPDRGQHRQRRRAPRRARRRSTRSARCSTTT